MCAESQSDALPNTKGGARSTSQLPVRRVRARALNAGSEWSDFTEMLHGDDPEVLSAGAGTNDHGDA